MGHAGTSLERCDGDDREARGARAEDDTSFRLAKLAHARVSGADARVVFSRSTVWRLGHPSADPRPADSRAPPSAFSSPTYAVGAEQGVSRGASCALWVSRSSLSSTRGVSGANPATPLRRAVDGTRANEIFQSFLTVRSSLPQSLLGQEVVITLGDASTRQGTVCDVDRQGTVALSKVRRSSARAPTAPLVRGETPRLRRKRPGAIQNRRFAPPFSVFVDFFRVARRFSCFAGRS